MTAAGDRVVFQAPAIGVQPGAKRHLPGDPLERARKTGASAKSERPGMCILRERLRSRQERELHTSLVNEME